MRLSARDDQFVTSVMLVVGIAAALAVPAIAAAAAPLVMPALFLVVVGSLGGFATESAGTLFTFDRDEFLAVGWQQFALPLGVLACGWLSGADAKLVGMLALTAGASSVFAAPAIAELLDLDRGVAARTMIVSTLVAPFSTMMIAVLVGLSAGGYDLVAFVERIGVFLILPLALMFLVGPTVRRMSQPAQARYQRGSRYVASTALAVFGVGLMSGIDAAIAADGWRVLALVCCACALTFVMAATTVLVTLGQGVRRAGTYGVLAAFRNVGLSYAVLETTLDREYAVFVGLTQLPLFLAPVVILLLVGRSTIDVASRAVAPKTDAVIVPSNRTTTPSPALVVHEPTIAEPLAERLLVLVADAGTRHAICQCIVEDGRTAHPAASVPEALLALAGAAVGGAPFDLILVTTPAEERAIGDALAPVPNLAGMPVARFRSPRFAAGTSELGRAPEPALASTGLDQRRTAA